MQQELPTILVFRHDVFLDHGLPQVANHHTDRFYELLLPNNGPVVFHSEAAKTKVKN
jgi:hypothetical protein